MERCPVEFSAGAAAVAVVEYAPTRSKRVNIPSHPGLVTEKSGPERLCGGNVTRRREEPHARGCNPQAAQAVRYRVHRFRGPDQDRLGATGGAGIVTALAG